MATIPPERAAALMADLPLMTFSRSVAPPGPRALLPMRVTLSQSSDMLVVLEAYVVVALSVIDKAAKRWRSTMLMSSARVVGRVGGGGAVQQSAE